MPINPNYPKLFQITLTLNAPANATEEDVRRIVRVYLHNAAKIVEIKPLDIPENV